MTINSLLFKEGQHIAFTAVKKTYMKWLVTVPGLVTQACIKNEYFSLCKLQPYKIIADS